MNIIQDTRLINLYSQDSEKLNLTKNSNVIFNFNSLLSDQEDIIHCTIGIVSAQIPVSYYIITNNNNVLKVNTHTITITNGNYDANKLITEVTKKLFSVGLTISITISKITGLLTFSSDVILKFYPSSLMPILGFEMDTLYASSSIILKHVLTSPYPCNLLGIQRISINSSSLSSYNSNSNSLRETTAIASIPCSASPFGMILYTNVNSYCLLKAKNITSIDIQITDENDQLLDFNNVNWSMTLQLNIFRKINTDIDRNMPFKPIMQILEEIETDLSKTKDKPLEEVEEQPEPELNDDLETLLYNHLI